MEVRKLFLICIVVLYGTVYPRQDDEGNVIGQVKIGNLAVPGSQQMGNTFGFGQNIIDRGIILTFFTLDFLKGKKKGFTEIDFSVLYGIRDNLSLLMELSVENFKVDGKHSSGLGDLTAQLEYAFYSYATETYTNQMTVVTSVLLPTGNACKELPTGFGSPSFFVGLTAYHLATDWYYYASPGVLLTTRYGNNTKFGNTFFYQFGIGKNIAYCPNKWIFSWEIELIGSYEQQNKINGCIDSDSGGNTLLLGPSLYFANDRLVFQASIAPIISQDLFGDQPKDWFVVLFGVTWLFN